MVTMRIDLAKHAPLRIGALVVEPAARTVIGQDGVSERLEPRVMQVLVRLAEGGVVGRDDLTECCWGGTIVGEDAINRVISRLRRVAEERGGGFRIETIPRIGYRLLGEVTPVAHPEPPPAPGLPAPVPALTLIRQGDVRRRKFWVRWAVAGTLVSVAMTGLAGEALRARADARARRADAEQLVEFMLGDLRKRLDAVGRLDVLDAVGAQTMAYYARQNLGSLNADELARRAKALRMVGELKSQRGDFAAAAAAFGDAARTTGELMAREPENGQRVFDHAQSVFWLGDLELTHGNVTAAARSMEEYAHLADRLAQIDPNRPDWHAEVAYSRQNRGAIAYWHRDVEAAIRDFSQAAAIFNDLARRDNHNSQWQMQVAVENAWLADALRLRGDLDAALRAREIERGAYQRLAAADPADTNLQQSLAWSENALAELALDRGDLDAAFLHATVATRIIEKLVRIEPNNVEFQQRAVAIQSNLSLAQALKGQGQSADVSIASARRIASSLESRDPTIKLWRSLGARADLVQAWLSLRQHNRQLSAWLSDRALESFSALGQSSEFASDELAWRARAHAFRAEAKGPEDTDDWRATIALIEPLRPNLRLDEQCLLAAAYRRSHRLPEAETIQSALLARGYRNPLCPSAII